MMQTVNGLLVPGRIYFLLRKQKLFMVLSLPVFGASLPNMDNDLSII